MVRRALLASGQAAGVVRLRSGILPQPGRQSSARSSAGTKKCLILDLDNTLWGGVIGDDGLAGIQIGEGGAEGEAFKAFQAYVRQLKERGVLLAVCSKNDEAIAKSAFTDHPDMVLKLDDFVVFKANWQPKSENIRAIAQEMDLPLEAFVFVDDNPAERHEVRQALADVTVPELPDDPSGFMRALDGERLFEVVAVTREDLQRTATYHARRQTLEALAGTTDIPAYLASLAMTASVRPFEPVSFDRITQLINKTNQFNLTTPRVVPADVVRLAADPASVTCTVRLKDRFADHGLISVVYGRAHERTARDRRLVDELPRPRARRRAASCSTISWPRRVHADSARLSASTSRPQGMGWSGITTQGWVLPGTATWTDGSSGGCRSPTPSLSRCSSRSRRLRRRTGPLRHDT